MSVDPSTDGNGLSVSHALPSLSNWRKWLRPFRIVSLWEMHKFRADMFFAIASTVENVRAGANFLAKLASHEKIPDDIWKGEPETLRSVIRHCDDVGMEYVQPHINRMLERFEGKYGGYDSARLATDLGELYWRVQDEMEKILVMRIPKDRSDYFEKVQLFGPEVATNFPSANFDIEEAGNCYATDRNTACVFHSMRVLEHGLRALAADLQISFSTPIELENWQNIIEKIESEIREINKQPKGMQKTQDLQFYSEAAKEFRYFKDAWRNHVSHSREEYGDAEAYRVLTHVKDFMQHLATRLKE